MVAQACGNKLASKLSMEKIAPRDWVKDEPAGLKPVDGRPLRRARRA